MLNWKRRLKKYLRGEGTNLEKDEEKGELNVFLGDDSDTFVSWISFKSICATPGTSSRSSPYCEVLNSETSCGKTELQHTSSEAEKRTSDITSGKRYNMEGKGLVRNWDENVIPLSRNSLAENVHSKDDPSHIFDRTKLSRSPRLITRKKRRKTEEQRPRKLDW